MTSNIYFVGCVDVHYLGVIMAASWKLAGELRAVMYGTRQTSRSSVVEAKVCNDKATKRSCPSQWCKAGGPFRSGWLFQAVVLAPL